MLEQQLADIKQKLRDQKNQYNLISQLQLHSSFVCQSESLEDYFSETEFLLSQVNLKARVISDNEQKIADKLLDQISVLARLAQAQRIQHSDQSNAHPANNTIGKMHATLAQYRSYLRQFDDKLFQLAPYQEQYLAQINQLQQRRANCQNAIEQLEKKLAFSEKHHLYGKTR
ncbi:hypothetical protein C2869_12010 [Saccharobesus litoralis]|uniref:Uncharacterized protein n=1 Tax=Saccharobesus litoralis TaxID=2172099 RepID=A0A2S0VSG2_9ALTE|nr:primosomal replication protein PriC [Saccharobesus litoralis]AWB67112.1 hypothetical protein C2869_12010 [Saccharobesus litoralis]